MSISENLKIINEKIRNQEIKSGRKENSVKLMAVSKFNPKEAVIEAINANQFLFGENRVQEAKEKFPQILESNTNVNLHMIGSLQTNKVKTAVQMAQCIQSVDRIDLIREIEKQCSKLNKKINILFEIHTGEDSKSGFKTEKELFEVLDLFADNNFSHITPLGFMTMAPFTSDEKLIRQSFISLRKLQEKCQNQYRMLNFSELSMGMSGDFEIAIDEGSTLVRVGTAIFGQRDYTQK